MAAICLGHNKLGKAYNISFFQKCLSPSWQHQMGPLMLCLTKTDNSMMMKSHEDLFLIADLLTEKSYNLVDRGVI